MQKNKILFYCSQNPLKKQTLDKIFESGLLFSFELLLKYLTFFVFPFITVGKKRRLEALSFPCGRSPLFFLLISKKEG
ncbi:MAG: hypothetical protein DLD55_04110 [candidate division SR1 bacterium]|nr:MAG: hypothetical protein DLD55_04110 [candidate division SR1 bacterium]